MHQKNKKYELTIMKTGKIAKKNLFKSAQAH